MLADEAGKSWMTLLLSSSCGGLAANKKADTRTYAPLTDCVCMHKNNN